MTTPTVLPVMLCKQCNHEWVPRVPDPVRCPNCMTRNWNRERREEPAAKAGQAS